MKRSQIMAILLLFVLIFSTSMFFFLSFYNLYNMEGISLSDSPPNLHLADIQIECTNGSIENQTYTQPVDLINQSIYFKNCTFQQNIEILSNSSGPSTIIMSNCSLNAIYIDHNSSLTFIKDTTTDVITYDSSIFDAYENASISFENVTFRSIFGSPTTLNLYGNNVITVNGSNVELGYQNAFGTSPTVYIGNSSIVTGENADMNVRGSAQMFLQNNATLKCARAWFYNESYLDFQNSHFETTATGSQGRVWMYHNASMVYNYSTFTLHDSGAYLELHDNASITFERMTLPTTTSDSYRLYDHASFSFDNVDMYSRDIYLYGNHSIPMVDSIFRGTGTSDGWFKEYTTLNAFPKNDFYFENTTFLLAYITTVDDVTSSSFQINGSQINSGSAFQRRWNLYGTVNFTASNSTLGSYMYFYDDATVSLDNIGFMNYLSLSQNVVANIIDSQINTVGVGGSANLTMNETNIVNNFFAGGGSSRLWLQNITINSISYTPGAMNYFNNVTVTTVSGGGGVFMLDGWDIPAQLPEEIFIDYQMAPQDPLNFILAGNTINITNTPAKIGLKVDGQDEWGTAYLKNVTISYIDIEPPWDGYYEGALWGVIEDCTVEGLAFMKNATWGPTYANVTFINTTFESTVDLQGGYFDFIDCNFESLFTATGTPDRINLTNCNMTDTSFCWLSPNGKTDVFISDSDLYTVRAEQNTSLVIDESNSEFLSLFDFSSTNMTDSYIRDLRLKEQSTIHANNCQIDLYNFESPEHYINNSYIPLMAPTVVEQFVNTTTPIKAIINWTNDPGQNITGNVKNYTIFRANLARGSPEPSDTAYTAINWTTLVNYTDVSVIEDQDYWYKVEIRDDGDNYANSTELLVSIESRTDLVANVYLNSSLTTLDDVVILITVTTNDIDGDLTEDVNRTVLNITYVNQDQSSYNRLIEASLLTEGILYQYTFVKNASLDRIEFQVIVEQDDRFLPQNHNFNSSIFTILSPDIEPGSVNYPIADRIPDGIGITISITIAADVEYLDNITIFYRYSAAGSWMSDVFTYNNATGVFSYSFGPFAGTPIEYLEYCIYSYDLAGNSESILGTFSNPIEAEIYPLFPTATLDAFQLMLIVFGSLIIGMIAGPIYYKAETSQKLKNQKKIQEKEKTILKEMRSKTKDIESPAVKDLLFGAETGTITAIFYVLISGTIALLIGSVVTFLMISEYVSLFFVLGAFILMLYTLLVWLQKDVNISISKEKLRKKSIVMTFFLSIGLLATVFWFLAIGSFIPWIRYYILEQGGLPPLMSIFGFNLHVLYPKLLIIYFSSLIFVIISIYNDIRKNTKNLSLLHLQNASVSAILEQKEEFKDKISGRVAFKMVVFLLMIGITIIPYTADGFLTIVPAGIAILGPFALVMLVFVVLVSLKSKSLKQLDMIIEKTKNCPKCKAVNVMTSLYCGNCGDQLLFSETLYDKVTKCPKCFSPNPTQAKFCRHCRTNLEPMKAPEIIFKKKKKKQN